MSNVKGQKAEVKVSGRGQKRQLYSENDIGQNEMRGQHFGFSRSNVKCQMSKVKCQRSNPAPIGKGDAACFAGSAIIMPAAWRTPSAGCRRSPTAERRWRVILTWVWARSEERRVGKECRSRW